MLKTTLSVVTITILSSLVSASTITLCQDKETVAICTKLGPNRIELGNFVSAKNNILKSKLCFTQIIGGVAYTYNKNVKFIANVYDIDVEDDSIRETK